MPDNIMTMEAPGFRNRSASIAALAGALAEAQKNFGPIPKDRGVTVTTQTGASYKFKYATLDAIMSATMPALADQGLAISQALTEWGSNYAVETTLYHKSGEWISNVTPMFLAGKRTKEGRDLPPGNQELGSAQTYARRYGYSALLCITADEDDDGNHADGNHATGERIPFKPGVAGSAGGGTQFRPARRQQSSWGEGGKQGAIEEAQRDGLTANAPPKGTLPAKTGPLGGREATPEEALATKIRNAVDKRIDILKAGSPWFRDGLDQFWADDKKWIEWMSDPNNKQLKEYQRFTDAFAEAEINSKPMTVK